LLLKTRDLLAKDKPSALPDSINRLQCVFPNASPLRFKVIEKDSWFHSPAAAVVSRLE
jgi:hypothetical protein